MEFFRIKNPSILVSSFFHNWLVVLLTSSIDTSSLSLIPNTFPFEVFSIMIESSFTWKFHSSLECQISALLIKVDPCSFHNWPRNNVLLITESLISCYFLRTFKDSSSDEKTSKGKSIHDVQKQKIRQPEKLLILFYIDNSIANISLYILSWPKLNLRWIHCLSFKPEKFAFSLKIARFDIPVILGAGILLLFSYF